VEAHISIQLSARGVRVVMHEKQGTYDVVAFVNNTDLSLGNKDQGDEDAGQ
jgi:hypothetical protein